MFQALSLCLIAVKTNLHERGHRARSGFLYAKKFLNASIYKAQGSEYPVVILPLYMQHYMILTRNLFYTGLTRAKRLAIVIGSKKAISLALRSTEKQQRYTQLQQKLVQEFIALDENAKVTP